MWPRDRPAFATTLHREASIEMLWSDCSLVIHGSCVSVLDNYVDMMWRRGGSQRSLESCRFSCIHARSPLAFGFALIGSGVESNQQKDLRARESHRLQRNPTNILPGLWDAYGCLSCL